MLTSSFNLSRTFNVRTARKPVYPARKLESCVGVSDVSTELCSDADNEIVMK
jgi:hypothetical protein